MTRKQLNLDLEGKDGNIFMLLGYFSKEAKRADWSQEEIDSVLKDAKSDDYDHAIQVLMNV